MLQDSQLKRLDVNVPLARWLRSQTGVQAPPGLAVTDVSVLAHHARVHLVPESVRMLDRALGIEAP